MEESDVRKWHARAGIVIALLVLLQASTGLVLGVLRWVGTVDAFAEPASYVGWAGVLHRIHNGAWPLGVFYHVVLGMGLIWMVVSGGWILLQMRRRR